ncbi:MAG: dTMP kinase [Chloroflexota bacterium]|nr:dTMP kinase [Chloroflexota bacterium]
MEAKAGRFIVLEGVDGAGKSRAIARLADHVRAAGRPLTVTREPGGTHLGEQIRGLLLDSDGATRAPETDALLFNAARSQLVREVIRPALERGDVVLCDRFGGSTLAYQGHGSGVDVSALRVLESFATHGTEPGLVLLLDLPAADGLARRGRGDPAELNRFEDESRHDTAFHQRVRSGYLALADADPARWRVIDASREPDAIDAELAAVVDVFLASSEPERVPARMRG